MLWEYMNSRINTRISYSSLKNPGKFFGIIMKFNIFGFRNSLHCRIYYWSFIKFYECKIYVQQLKNIFSADRHDGY